MSIREWTGWRITAAWVLWFILACGAALGFAIAYAQVHPAPEPRTTGHAAGPVIGRTYSIALNGWLVVGIFVGPPAVLTAVWLWQRRQHLRAAT